MAPQRTALYVAETAAGAGFHESHGFDLPQTYGDLLAEYRASREGAAVYDSSYMGKIRATGTDALDLLNRLSTNQVVSLQPGEGAPTVLTTDRGRILDLVAVTNLGDHVLVLTSPQAAGRVIEWIDKYTIADDVSLEDITSLTAMISVLGPKADSVLNGLTGVEPGGFEPFQSAPVKIANSEGYVIRRPMVNLQGFEVVVAGEDATSVWEAIVAAGAVPIGTAAYEVVRVEEGAPEYGSELSEDYNPLETGLWGSISFTKGCYIGQEVIARLDTYQKVQKHLVSLSFEPEAWVEAGVKLASDGKEVGQVTSVVKLPTTGELIGLGYVRKEASTVGSVINLADGGAWARVEAALLPFGPGEST